MKAKKHNVKSPLKYSIFTKAKQNEAKETVKREAFAITNISTIIQS
jgi:hypothetical protein